jgi:hypothetical protein
MTIVALTSARGAPGVTTTALTATLTWPRPVLLVEADVCGSSSIKAGHLRGEYGHHPSLINLVVAHRNSARRNGLNLDTLRDQTIALTDDRSRLLLPGLATRAQAASLTGGFWDALATLLGAVSDHGVDVIVDAGRMGIRHGPDSLLRDADLVALVSRTGLDDLVTARANVDQLPGEHTGVAVERRGLLLVGEGQPHRAREAAKATTLPVWASIAWDPVAAEKINGRERVRTSLARVGTSRLVRSVRTTVTELIDTDRRRRQLLVAPISVPEMSGGSR